MRLVNVIQYFEIEHLAALFGGASNRRRLPSRRGSWVSPVKIQYLETTPYSNMNPTLALPEAPNLTLVLREP